MGMEALDKTDALRRSALPRVCSSYDADCLDMTVGEATWCFLGCKGHPCATPGSIWERMGQADGHCPIMAKAN